MQTILKDTKPYMKLKNLRTSNRFTTQYMADKLGISKPYYCQIENCLRRLNYELSVKIATIFNVRPDAIFYKETKEKIANSTLRSK